MLNVDSLPIPREDFVRWTCFVLGSMMNDGPGSTTRVTYENALLGRELLDRGNTTSCLLCPFRLVVAAYTPEAMS